jgi:predicted TIM-barrel fold metal-dependent hydrolase
MNQSRRQFLGSGAMAGAFTGLFAGAGRATADPSKAKPVSPEPPVQNDNTWGRGVAPGQNLPPEATNGPWRNLRAVKEKKVIDVHTHPYETPTQGHNYAEETRVHALDQWKDYSDALVGSMDRHGIAGAVLTSAFVTYEQVLATSFKAHPGRFIHSCGLPTEATKAKSTTGGVVLPGAEVQLSPAQLASIVREQLMRDGCKIIGETTGDAIPRVLMTKYPVEELKPLVDVALEFDVPVQIHCGWTATGTALGMGQHYGAAWRWAETMGTLMAAYPELKVIIAHTGGRFAALDGWEAVRLLFSFDNAYCDTAKTTPEIVTEVVKGIGAERVLFGSDWNRPEMKTYGPYHMRNVYQHWYNLNTIAQADLTEDQRDSILYKSAKKLLKLA